MIAGTRLRRGPTNSTRGAARLIADALACTRKAGATGAITIRAQLITVPARIAYSARRLRLHLHLHLHLHLTERWPWEDVWNAMFAGAYDPVPAT